MLRLVYAGWNGFVSVQQLWDCKGYQVDGRLQTRFKRVRYPIHFKCCMSRLEQQTCHLMLFVVVLDLYFSFSRCRKLNFKRLRIFFESAGHPHTNVSPRSLRDVSAILSGVVLCCKCAYTIPVATSKSVT